MYASDFRAAARRALSGNWPLAIIAGVLASILSGIQRGSNLELSIDLAAGGISLSAFGYELEHLFRGPFSALVMGWLGSMAMFSFLFWLAWYILGSVISVGYARFNLDLTDGKDARLESLFGYFPQFLTAVCTRLLVSLFTFLWSLLLFIPGIVASYSYSMTSFLLSEHPELTAREAISQSKQLMRGNRWRLFCLDLSFLGWNLLVLFTFGIGMLFLTPYYQAARAAFYRSLTTPASAYENKLEF